MLDRAQNYITVFKPKDIEDKEKLLKEKPYMELTLDDQKAKSTTVKNNHNLKWNFEAILMYLIGHPRNYTLQCLMMILEKMVLLDEKTPGTTASFEPVD